jgi:SAM-dependent methyltransferase
VRGDRGHERGSTRVPPAAAASLAAEFCDPRLVAIYDTVNAYRPDAQPGFYLQLAAESDAGLVIDLGCGTGLITCELARAGHDVIGVDPSLAMLDVARRRGNGTGVRWIVGDATALGTPGADLAIMTGHVAQFFVTDDDWDAVLATLHSALRPGGRLAFETRNPGAREWEQWFPTRRTAALDPAAGRVETWVEVHEVASGIVSCTNHYRFIDAGGELLSPHRLRFRTEQELRVSLAGAGFAVEHVYGDWDRRPAGPVTRELVVVAS